MKTGLPFTAMIALLFGSSLSMGQQGAAQAGKASYDKQCATCHGADGTAKEPIAKMLKVEIKHLGSKEVQAKSDADLRKVITEGYGKMKAVKTLADKDAANVIAYVRTLTQK